MSSSNSRLGKPILLHRKTKSPLFTGEGIVYRPDKKSKHDNLQLFKMKPVKFKGD